ncbi:MAG: hypothetical protein PWP24_1538 [Clostridiales bacterium]|nr:hypothetical protein [Clostridiales bacterium]
MAKLYESFNDTFDQLPVKLYRHDLAGEYIWAPLHWHRSIELLITFEGHLAFNIGSDNFHFIEDDWMIVNSSQLHSSRYVNPSDHFRGISILFSLPFIESWIGKGSFFYNPHIPEVTNRIKDLALDFYDHASDAPFYALSFMSKVYELL